MPVIPTRSRSLRKPTNYVDTNPVNTTNTNATTKAIVTNIPRTKKFEDAIEFPQSCLPTKPTRNPSQLCNSREGHTQQNHSHNHVSAKVAMKEPSEVEIKGLTLNGRPKVSSTDVLDTERDRNKSQLNTNSRHINHTSISFSSINTCETSKRRERSSTNFTNSSTSRPPTRGSVMTDVIDPPSHSRLEGKPSNKPTFNTHQKYYSPAKIQGPKLHPAAFLAPPTPSKWASNRAISAETVKLQNELLQLHLLHRDSGRVKKEWKNSAKEILKSRFQNMIEKEQISIQMEKHENSKLNAITLKEWQCIGVPGLGLDYKIQKFDEILTGVFAIEEEGGRYTQVVQTFKKWVNMCQQIIDNRTRKDEIESEFIFIESLGSTWTDECFFLWRKLELWKDNIRDLGIPQCESSLGMVIDQIQKIVLAMLAELNLMVRLEEEVMKMEEFWIREMNNELIDEQQDDKSKAGAIWRSIGLLKS